MSSCPGAWYSTWIWGVAVERFESSGIAAAWMAAIEFHVLLISDMY